jgi:hypothetical protein
MTGVPVYNVSLSITCPFTWAITWCFVPSVKLRHDLVAQKCNYYFMSAWRNHPEISLDTNTFWPAYFIICLGIVILYQLSNSFPASLIVVFWYYLQVNNACATGSSALFLAKQLVEGGIVQVTSTFIKNLGHVWKYSNSCKQYIFMEYLVWNTCFWLCLVLNLQHNDFIASVAFKSLFHTSQKPQALKN